jgi:hypothetical protein
MGIGRAAFARPIEITTASKDVQFNASAQSIAVGTYGCIATLLNEVKAHMTAAGIASPAALIQTSAASSSYGKVILRSSSTFSITWTDAGLATALGFSGAALSGAVSYTGGSMCPYLWVSRYTPSDRETWALDMRSNYAGQLTRTGELVGAATGPDIYHRTLRFDGELGSNVFRSLAATTDVPLETFLNDARTAVPTLSTNQATKGFYYFFDVLDLASTLSSVTSGSVVSWGDTSKYVWVYPDEKGLEPPRATHGVTRGYYGFDLRLHTGTAPTWDAP